MAAVQQLRTPAPTHVVPVPTQAAVWQQLSHRPAVQELPSATKPGPGPVGSFVSTALPCSVQGSVTASEGANSQEQPPSEPLWSVHQTIRLGALGGHQEAAFERDGIHVLEPSAVASVSSAVDMLNRGTLSCPEGCCVVYSQSNQVHFLVYRHGLMYHALSLAAKFDDPAQGLVVQPATMQPPGPPCSSSLPARPSTPPRSPRRASLPQVLQTPRTSPSGKAQAKDRSSPGCSPTKANRSGRSPQGRSEAVSETKSESWSRMSVLDDWVRIGAELRSALEAADQSRSPPPAEKNAERARRQHAELQSAPAPQDAEPQAAPAAERREPADQDAKAGAPGRETAELDGCEPALEAASAVISRSGGVSPPAAEVRTSRASRHDSELEIGGHRFQMMGVLGRGAFGVVRKAREATPSGDRVVAVKTMSAKTSEALDVAIFESELLKALSDRLPTGSAGRVPQYVAHCSTSSSRGGCVQLAMSYIPGIVLDQWLYGISDAEHKHVDVNQLVDGRLPGGRQRTTTLADACSFTGVLVTQLAGVLSVCRSIAFHRDISSHNVLVDFGRADAEGNRTLDPSFALIDFGLAVKSSTWRRDWNSSNLAGDPRYWTAPAWMAFAFGFPYVESHPNQGFVKQYLGRIDHYSAGILGLEMLFALWNEEGRFDEERAPGMMEARAAWCEFWEAAVRIFQMFHVAGPQATREHLAGAAEGEGIARIASLLSAVRARLRASASDPSMKSKSALLLVLADLVDEHGSLDWEEVQVALTTGRLPGGLASPQKVLAAADGRPQDVEAAPAPGGQGFTPKALSDALATSRHHLGLRARQSTAGAGIRIRTLSPPAPQARTRERSLSLTRVPSQVLPVMTARGVVGERRSAMVPQVLLTGRPSYTPPAAPAAAPVPALPQRMISFVPHPQAGVAPGSPMRAPVATQVATLRSPAAAMPRRVVHGRSPAR